MNVIDIRLVEFMFRVILFNYLASITNYFPKVSFVFPSFSIPNFNFFIHFLSIFSINSYTITFINSLLPASSTGWRFLYSIQGLQTKYPLFIKQVSCASPFFLHKKMGIRKEQNAKELKINEKLRREWTLQSKNYFKIIFSVSPYWKVTKKSIHLH